jgi:hypothetical protein
MLDERYLLSGLNALSRAHRMDYFADGHRGAALISAYYLCRESDVEPGVSDTIAAIVDEHWTQTDLCAPFPPEEPCPDRLGRVADSLARSIGQLREVGHNVIFASLALKALRQMPEAIIPSRVAGICRLIDSFKVMGDIPVAEDVVLPRFDDTALAAEAILSEFLGAMDRFEGRGQGWSGHLLTYGRALLDLQQLDYSDLVLAGLDAFRCYVGRIRMGPQATDKPRPEHPESNLRPTQTAYWHERRNVAPKLGHVFKYAYGLYGLLRLTPDRDFAKGCLARASPVL